MRSIPPSPQQPRVALYRAGDLDLPSDFNRRGAEGARQRGDPETIANAELNLADAFLAQGDLALAQEFLDGVSRLVHDPATSDWMKWRYSTHLFASLGDSGWPAVTPPGRRSSPPSAWTSLGAPTRGSISSRAGDSRERLPWAPPGGRSGRVVATGPDAGPDHWQPDAALEDPPRPGPAPRRGQAAGASPAGIPGRPCGHRAGQGTPAELRAARQSRTFPADSACLRPERFLFKANTSWAGRLFTKASERQRKPSLYCWLHRPQHGYACTAMIISRTPALTAGVDPIGRPDWRWCVTHPRLLLLHCPGHAHQYRRALPAAHRWQYTTPRLCGDG